MVHNKWRLCINCNKQKPKNKFITSNARRKTGRNIMFSLKKLIGLLFISFLCLGSTFQSASVTTEWTQYTMTIGGVTTPPTKGTIVHDKAFFKVIGKTLFIKYYYQQSSGGGGGSGEYLYPLPAGFTVNTDITPVAVASAEPRSVVLGVAHTQTGVVDGNGYVTVHDSTNLKITTQNAGINSHLYNSNTSFSFTATDLIVSFSAEVPIN